MTDYTLREIQQQVDDWVQKVGKSYWSPHEMLARLVEEVGETSRLINHLYGPKNGFPSIKEAVRWAGNARLEATAVKWHGLVSLNKPIGNCN